MPQSSENGRDFRDYEVLEQVELTDLIEQHQSDSEPPSPDVVFVRRGTYRARNTESALRNAGKEHLDVAGDLVAVPTRHFQVEPVTITTERTVQIG